MSPLSTRYPYNSTYANKKSKAWAAFLSLMIDIEHMPIIIIKFVSFIFLFSSPSSYIRLHVVMITCITNPSSWLLFRTQLNVWYCNSSSRYLGIYFPCFLSKKKTPLSLILVIYIPSYVYYDL